MNRILFVAAAFALLLSACGAPAAPTIDAAQVQASAVGAAATMIAETQAAMPTNTPVPPTPLTSPTAQLSPTLAQLATLPVLSSPTTAASGGDCNHLLDVGAAGPTTTLLIRNNTKGAATFSMGLGSNNFYGQCGYLGWSVPKGSSITVSVPQTRTNQGDPCYWVYAWVNDPKHQTTLNDGGYCLNNPDKWTIDIGYDKMKLTPP